MEMELREVTHRIILPGPVEGPPSSRKADACQHLPTALHHAESIRGRGGSAEGGQVPGPAVGDPSEGAAGRQGQNRQPGVHRLWSTMPEPSRLDGTARMWRRWSASLQSRRRQPSMYPAMHSECTSTSDRVAIQCPRPGPNPPGGRASHGTDRAGTRPRPWKARAVVLRSTASGDMLGHPAGDRAMRPRAGTIARVTKVLTL
jgi:hypothetical protein